MQYSSVITVTFGLPRSFPAPLLGSYTKIVAADSRLEDAISKKIQQFSHRCFKRLSPLTASSTYNGSLTLLTGALTRQATVEIANIWVTLRLRLNVPDTRSSCSRVNTNVWLRRGAFQESIYFVVCIRAFLTGTAAVAVGSQRVLARHFGGFGTLKVAGTALCIRDVSCSAFMNWLDSKYSAHNKNPVFNSLTVLPSSDWVRLLITQNLHLQSNLNVIKMLQFERQLLLSKQNN